MAVAYGAPLGEIHTTGSGTTRNLTTTAVVPSGAKVIVVVHFYCTGVLNSISGGSLTWTIDKQQVHATDTHYRVAIASAEAPSGLASSTVLTATTAATYDLISVQAFYITGAATASAVDITAGVGTNGGASVSTNITTTNANDLIVQGFLVAFISTSDITPVASMTEIYDTNQTDGIKCETAYRIVTSTGTYAMGGSWATGLKDYVIAGVAYKQAAAATANSGFFRMMGA